LISIATIVAALVTDHFSRAQARDLAEGIELEWSATTAHDAMRLAYSCAWFPDKAAKERAAEALLPKTGLARDDKVAYLGSIWIPFEHRGAGHGHKVMDVLEREAARLGARAVVLYATKIDGPDPRPFYLSRGYLEADEGRHSSVMVKGL